MRRVVSSAWGIALLALAGSFVFGAGLAIAAQKYLIKIPAITIEIEAAPVDAPPVPETKPDPQLPPAEPVPPVSNREPVSTWLVEREGKLVDATTGQAWRAWGTNVVGYAITHSTLDELDRFLDRCALADVRLIRVHGLDGEIGSDGSWPTWFENDSTMRYSEPVLARLDWFFEACGKRGIRVWLTMLHRRILTSADGPETPFGTIALWSELQGTRPGGVFQGEIRETLFFDPVIEALARHHARQLLGRRNTVNGKLWSDDPTLAIVSVCNELDPSRAKGYAPADRSPGSDFKAAWLARWDEFNAGKNLKGTKQEINFFLADLAFRFHSRMIADLRAAGFKGICNSSSVYGDCPMVVLCGQLAGNLLDCHIYGPDDETQQDPLDPNTDGQAERTLGSVLAAARLAGKPLAVSEWGSVYQRGAHAREKSPSWLRAPRYVGQVAADHGVAVAVHYAAASHPIGGPKANNESYDGERDPAFWQEFIAGGAEFYKPAASGALPARALTVEELFGRLVPRLDRPGSDFVHDVPGSQAWAIEGRSRGFERLQLPRVDALPWLR